MYIVTSSLLILLATHSLADINAIDYVYQTKEEISAWHQYVPSRLLEQERLTNLKAAEIVETLVGEIGTSLAASVKFQSQELETAQFIMEGTSAQGCVRNLSDYMGRAVAEGVSYFQDHVTDIPSQLQRLYQAWAKTNVSYSAAYQRTLVEIDACLRTYLNRNSWARLKTCVDTWAKNYFTIANSTTKDLYWGSTLDGTVMYNVVEGAQRAAAIVRSRGREFLDELVQCANLSEALDYEAYKNSLYSESFKYETTIDLDYQILALHKDEIKNIEQKIILYYIQQKRALEKTTNRSYYYNSRIAGYIQKYLDTVSSTEVDYPANVKCISEAKYALRDILYNGVMKAWDCDNQITKHTTFLIARVKEYVSKINKILPYTGNVAILSCLSEGYIFAEKAISNCYSLAWNSFKINITELNATIVDDVQVLLGYDTSFLSNSSLPCGSSVDSRAFLQADRAMYNLQRCLYISSETKYDETTSAPDTEDVTTTTNLATTTNPATIINPTTITAPVTMITPATMRSPTIITTTLATMTPTATMMTPTTMTSPTTMTPPASTTTLATTMTPVTMDTPTTTTNPTKTTTPVTMDTPTITTFPTTTTPPTTMTTPATTTTPVTVQSPTTTTSPTTSASLTTATP